MPENPKYTRSSKGELQLRFFKIVHIKILNFSGNDFSQSSSNIAGDVCKCEFTRSELANYVDVFQYFVKRLIRCKDCITSVDVNTKKII